MQNFFDDIFKAIQNPGSANGAGPPPVDQTQAATKGSGDGTDSKKPVKSDPFTALVTSVLGSGSGKGTSGAMPGLDWLGDFNPDSFVSGTLAKDRASGSSGGDFTKILGSLIKLL